MQFCIINITEPTILYICLGVSESRQSGGHDKRDATNHVQSNVHTNDRLAIADDDAGKINLAFSDDSDTIIKSRVGTRL